MTESFNRNANLKYRPDIDGLRAIAVLEPVINFIPLE
jgi:peptidoglycan/LPS O-acetylase OafA/YrhL